MRLSNIQRDKEDTEENSSMKKRVISAIVMAVVCLVAIYFGGYVFGAFFFLAVAIGLYEFYRAFENKNYKPVKSAGAVFLIMFALMVIFKSPSFTDLYIRFPFGIGYRNLFEPLLFVAVLMCLCAIVFHHEKHTFEDVGITMFGGFYVVYLMSYVLLLRNMDNGIWVVILPLITAISADTFALFTGMKLGKHKLIPKVSPNKTVEGAVGGWLGAVVFTVIYYFIMVAFDVDIGLKWFDFIIIGMLGGVLAQIGDLGASAIKRYVGVKDFGHLIPGHGGALDRIDSYMILFPLVYLYMVLRGVC